MSDEFPFSITDFQKQTALRIGAVWHRPKAAESTLASYCRHVFTVNESEDFPHSFPGSSSLIRYRDKYMQFCCRHQINGFEIGNLGFQPRTARTSVVSPSSVHYVEESEFTSGSDLLDLAALEYVPSDYGISNLSAEFFEVEPDEVWPSRTTGNLIVAGIPTGLVDLRYGDDAGLKASIVQFSATYEAASQSPFLHRIRTKEPLDFDADGVSGGPVFHIGADADGYFAGWAGMIIRGGQNGSSNLHFVEAAPLLKLALG